MNEIPLSDAAKAVSQPVRAEILARLASRVASPNELANEMGEPLGNCSYHVKVLHELGLVELVETAARRGATEHYYRAVWRVRVELDAVNGR